MTFKYMRDNKTYRIYLLLCDTGPLPEISSTHLLNLPYALFSGLDPQHDLLHYSPLQLEILYLPGKNGTRLLRRQGLQQLHELNSTKAVKIYSLTYDEWVYRICPNAGEARSTGE